MFKKLMLLSGIACGIAPLQAGSDSSSSNVTNAVIVGSAMAIMTGGAVYAARRETNISKINRTYRLIDLYGAKIQHQLLECLTQKDMSNLVAQSLVSKKEILFTHDIVGQLYREMDSRYNSWVAPWNWTPEMKQAFEAIKKLYNETVVLKMMFDHLPLLKAEHNEEALVKAARIFCAGASCYPTMYTVNRLQDDMQRIRGMRFYVPCEYSYAESLDGVVIALKSTDAYLSDCREWEKNLEQQRLIRATEEQACAQQSQARAQARQAAALEERNAIERQKSR